jgi:hypothetical protein
LSKALPFIYFGSMVAGPFLLSLLDLSSLSELFGYEATPQNKIDTESVSSKIPPLNNNPSSWTWVQTAIVTTAIVVCTVVLYNQVDDAGEKLYTLLTANQRVLAERAQATAARNLVHVCSNDVENTHKLLVAIAKVQELVVTLSSHSGKSIGYLSVLHRFPGGIREDE